MKSVMLFFCLLLCSTALYAQDPQGEPPLSKKSEKGSFVLELALGGEGLKNGPNALDLMLRDPAGKKVEGAEITVTPWMPLMGHGVWEKPVVTERGGGHYQVGNVVIIMSGLWELKVTVGTGEKQDRAGFSFYVAEKKEAPKEAVEQPRDGFQRQVASYSVPNVTLLNQDGQKVSLKELV